MTLPSNKPGESFKKFSRGKFLRDSVITASGIAFFPSMLSSCKKDFVTPDPGGGLGGTQTLTTSQLESAAANLTRMREWITDLYPLTIEYETAVFELLESTKNETPSWSGFIGKLFIDIAAGIANAIGGGPVFACLFAILKDWGNGINTPSDLEGTFGEFEIGHSRMQFAMEQVLSSLVDPSNNYGNLQTWKDPIEFNGKSYTLQDLANETFPGLGDAYNKLQSDAYTQFKKSLWNMVIIKTCTFQRWFWDYQQNEQNTLTVTEWARQFYSENKGVYLRGFWANDGGPGNRTLGFYAWNLGLNGNPFPDKAAAVLFKDDTPGHIINPEGLFVRSYVFEQFAPTKPDFQTWGNRISETDPDAFVPSGPGNDWPFTGGQFPDLTH